MDEVAALLDAPTRIDRPASATARCWSCCTPSGLRVSEAVGLDRQDLVMDAGFVRVIGKGDKERLVPVGDIALDAIERYLDAVRGPWLVAATRARRAHRARAARRAAVRVQPRAPPEQDGGLARRPTRGGGRRAARPV